MPLRRAQRGALISDRAHITLWQIDANGQVTAVMSLAGLPQSITPPIEIDNHLFMLAGPSPRFSNASSVYEEETPELFGTRTALPGMLAYSPSDHTSTWFYRDRLQPRKLCRSKHLIHGN